MKPNEDRALRVLLIAGSNRRQYNCPGVDGKARSLLFHMAARLPSTWDIDIEDLGNVYGRARIQSCNACVSTSMALCCWPCNCYEKNHRAEPDLMWDLDLYARLDLADAWAIIGPINWFGPSSNLKLMFDRLVCMNGGNPEEALIDHKDPEKAVALEQSPQWRALSQNHLEGRTAAFFSYGDEGGDEVDAEGWPKILQHRDWFDPAHWPTERDRDAYLPLVLQCRYSGIEVPDALWTVAHSGVGRPYSDNQAEDVVREAPFMT
ncbi:MAG: NAD(P)H-dependent oxidoreductase, partial [Sinobacteraceae bacterium]|nr:NAD(P)H-dependent oxidoreductase [Nevskiaceae bacterium]